MIWLVQSECKPPGYIYTPRLTVLSIEEGMPPPVLMQGLPKGYAHIVVQVTNLRKNMATLHANVGGPPVSLACGHKEFI